MDDIQSWWEVPSIAHFCSLFRAAFNLLDFDIEELEEALLTDGTEDAGSSLLQELIVRLLCGCVSNGQEISVFNYQMFLRRLFRKKCKEYGRYNPFNTDIDFQFLPLRTKVEILHALCDFRLDGEDVQDLLKNLESDSLRVEALGQDENSSAYWYFYGTRLYREDFPKLQKRKSREKKRGSRKKAAASTEDDSDEFEGESRWTVVCYTEQDWENLTTKLQDSIDPAEKALHHTLAVDFLPEIPRLFAEKEKLQMKRMLEYQPRRTSSRITKLNKQKVEAQQQQKRGKKSYAEVDEDILEEEEEPERPDVKEEAQPEEEVEAPKERRGRKPKAKVEEEEVRKKKSHSPAHKEKKSSKKVKEEEDEETRSSCGKDKEHVSKRGRHHKAHHKSRKSHSKKKGESSGEEDISDTESLSSSSHLVSRRGRGRGGARSSQGRGGHRSSPAPVVVAPTGRQTNNSLACATGPIFIQPASAATTTTTTTTTSAPVVTSKKTRKLRSSQVFAQSDEDLLTSMYKILESLKSHPDSWPFAEAVEEDYAPRYYAIVTQPMDLTTMEEKLDSGMYLSFSEFKSDFKLIVTNCKKYNGHENEYTEMVENLESVFERGASRYLETEFSTDEEVAIEFPAHKKESSPVPSSKHSSHSVSPERSQDRNSRSRSDMGRRGKRKAEAEEERRGRRKREAEKEEGRKHHKSEERRRKHHHDDKKHHKEEKERRSHREERRGRRRKIEREDEEVKSRSSDDEPLKKPATPKSPSPKPPAPPPVGPYGRRRAGPPPKPPAPRKPPERRRRSSDDDADEDLSEGDRENKEGSKKREAPRSAGNLRKRKKTGGIKNTAAIEALEIATEQTLKDINKWLDDTPRFSEFSSASNSPSHYLVAEEYSGSSAIDREYRRSLKMSSDDKKDEDGKKLRQEKRKAKPSHTSTLEALRDKRKKEVQRTIERLQPGKSKGNLISNLPKPKTEETGDVLNNSVKSNKEKCNSLVTKSDEMAPKLSLGSVLNTSIGFGKHTFTEKPVVEKEIKELVEEPASPEKVEEKEEPVKEEKEEEEKEGKEKKETPPVKVTPKVVPDSNKATPNLSAWFKAFGAPKAAPPKKKAEPEPVKPTPEPVKIIESVPEPIKSPSKSPEPQPQVSTEKPSRHRNLSTGSSSVSDLSAFSQDIGEMSEVASPRDRLQYHQSPPAMSPASPRPPPPPPTSHFPINGTIKVGFYQDTSSQKSSPDKGSPREETPVVSTPQTTPTYPQYTPPRSYPTISNPTYEQPAPPVTQFNPTPPVSKPISYNQPDIQYYDTSKPLTDQYREVNRSPPKTIQQQVHPEYTRPQNTAPIIPNIPTTIHHLHTEYPKLPIQPPVQQAPPIPSYPQPPPSYLTSNAPIKPNPMIIPQPPIRNVGSNLIIPQTQQNPPPDPKLLQQYPVKKRMVYSSEVMEEPRYNPMDMASYHHAQNQQRLVHPSLGLPPYYDPSTGSMLQPPYDLTSPIIKDTPQVPPPQPVKQKRKSKKAAAAAAAAAAVAQEAAKIPENSGAFQQYVAMTAKDAVGLKSSVPGSAFNFGTPGLTIPSGHSLYNHNPAGDKNSPYFADYRNFYDNKLKSPQVSAPQVTNQSTQPQQQQTTQQQQCISAGPTSPQSPFSFLGQPPTASRAPQTHHHHQNPYPQPTLPPTTTTDPPAPTYHQYQQMEQKSVYYHHQFPPQSHPGFAPPYSPSPPQPVATSTQSSVTSTRAPPHAFMMDSAPLYQQYLHRHQEELLLQAGQQRHPNPLLPVHQGLLGPPAGYPPGPYHPSLGIRQPFDGINRPSWL